ncbi:hypothetical protein [Acidiferrimicrobium sp. IK]|uniref:hypothetical protein n=1 Tax=Acidiferrimicrobium sp. IK TaxID=2871700 RepID=UPI0021CB5C21|nr:hypothetical protein [Acidiferrimicrobium sp. IK]
MAGVVAGGAVGASVLEGAVAGRLVPDEVIAGWALTGTVVLAGVDGAPEDGRFNFQAPTPTSAKARTVSARTPAFNLPVQITTERTKPA